MCRESSQRRVTNSGDSIIVATSELLGQHYVSIKYLSESPVMLVSGV